MTRSNRLTMVGAATGAVVAVLTTIANNHGMHFGALGRVLDAIQWPAVVVGMLVSGNAHAPSEFAGYLALFAMYFAALFLLIWAVRKLRSGQESRPTPPAA